MANAFNLTAQLNLKGPSNVGNIVSDIKKQLGTINANVNVAISANAGKNVAQLNTALQALNKTFQTTQVNATSAATAIAAFNSAVGNINVKSYQTGINGAVTATQQLTQTQSSVSKGLRASSSEMEEFGKQAGLAVRRFSAFSAVTSIIFGITNAFSKGISAFIDFDKELVKLQQVTGESAAGLQSLQDTITSLSTKLGVSSSELLNVSSTLAQAGLSARDTEKALKALALSSLAPSFDSMNETVEGSIALMRQFGIGAGDLTKALGSVNAVAAKFAVEASDIISAIQRTGGVFASASKGVSEGTQALNEFIAVFTSVRATTRESAETIATGLRTIFTRVQREGTIDALKEYGVNLTDLDGKFVGAYRAVELLSKGLNSIDPRDLKFSKIVEELGGFRQIGKVIPLIQEFGTAQQALSVAQAGQNSLTSDAAKAQLSLANQASKVREEFLALFREIGSSDTFQTLVRGSLQLVSSLIKVGDAVKGILPVLAVIGISKGLDAITKFGSGFVQGVRKGPDNKAGGFSEGGVVRRFATGGVVPGVGNSDSVPAMLTPGEFVVRKQAVKAIGSDKLHSMNKYSSGGDIKPQKFAIGGPASLYQDIKYEDTYDGDSLKVNVKPSQKLVKMEIKNDKGLVYPSTKAYKTINSRLEDADAYEMKDSPFSRGTKEGQYKDKAESAKNTTKKWAEKVGDSGIKRAFDEVNQVDYFGRPMFRSESLVRSLISKQEAKKFNTDDLIGIDKLRNRMEWMEEKKLPTETKTYWANLIKKEYQSNYRLDKKGSAVLDSNNEPITNKNRKKGLSKQDTDFFDIYSEIGDPKSFKSRMEAFRVFKENVDDSYKTAQYSIGGMVQKFAKGGVAKTAESILLSSLKQQSKDSENEYFKSSNNTVNNILDVSGVDKILAQIEKAYGVSSAKFLGSGGENAAFDIGDEVLKISRTGLGIQTLAKDFGVKKKDLDKMGNYQLPTGIDGVTGYRKVKTFGKLTAALQDKVVSRDTDKAMKDAQLLQGKLAKEGKYWLDAHGSNMGYDKKGKPTVIDGLILDKSFVDKMGPDYREDIEVEGMMAEAIYDKSLKKRKPQKKSFGGMIQKFAEGGKAVRRVGIIDSDVLRQTENAEKVNYGMKSIGADSITDYTIQLAKLAVQARKSDNLKKFRVIAGAAGSGKSSLATGVSAKDNATLRQTTRSHILTPEDISNVDEVLAITANVSDKKLESYLRDADRTYTVSSSTKAEQDLIKRNKESRDITGQGLYGREPGRTSGVSTDFGIEEATLIDELGPKNIVLGRKKDAQGNLTNSFRRKTGDELPEIVQAAGFYTGGFAPPTRGHRGAFDQLLANIVAKNPNATLKDIVVSVAPNVAMVEGKEGLAHAARYGIFDSDFRSLLADVNFKGAMISRDSQSTPGILPKVMEVPGENDRRKFARLQGAMAITSGKEKGVLGKYERAGIEVTDIPRIEDISATKVRELLFNQDYAELDKIVNPEVGAILKGNQPQLKNRSIMVPVLLEELNKAAEANTVLANEKADGILANAPGGPYRNISQKLKEEHPDIAAQVKSIRDQRDHFKTSISGAKAHTIISELSAAYPEIYGIDSSRRAATTAASISAEDARSHIGDRVQSLLPGGAATPEASLLESIKRNVTKQLAIPKGAGTLPTDSKTISSTFFNMPIPSDPAFGMFAGKTIDPGIVKKVWRQTYAGLSQDKEASYTALKTWLETQYNARTGAKTEELSQAIEESKMVGLVGMLPIGHERLSGPFTWMLGKNAAGDDVSVTASILERGLGKQYEDEVKKAQSHAEQGSELLASGLASKMKKGSSSLRSLSKDQLETLGQGNIEGAYVEQALARMWANLDNVSTRTRPIDYPDGLGESAELFPGISPTMPTEVKRTINSDSRSDAIEEFQRYFRLINGVPEPEAKKAAVKLASGGEVQKLMAGGVATKTKKQKEPFGTGETEFPTRISKKYAEEQYSASENLRSKLAWEKNPKDERIMVDEDKVQEAYQQPFDRERFTASFKEKISRDSLFERMSDFAKFIGLPQEDLSATLPLQLDFGASKRGGGLSMFAAAQFGKGALGVRPYEGYDLSKFGYGEKEKQEFYGIDKLITAKEKEIKKITKTPIRTYDDGSFSFDSEAYSKANDELRELKNKSFKLMDLKREAEKAALTEQNTVSSATGRGTISFAPSMGYSATAQNSLMYHELTHQLFEGLRKKSAGSFDKYRDRVSFLFSGDNDDLADAFDSLTADGGYSSADVVYGRSYKSNALDQMLSSYYRQNGDASRSATPIPEDITKNAAILSTQSRTTKKARDYRPINPKVNESLLQGGKFGATQEVINKMEDNGKEEFLTTLIERVPKLDSRLQTILDSTLTELLGGAGIQRQKYAIGGEVDQNQPKLIQRGGFKYNLEDITKAGFTEEQFMKQIPVPGGYGEQWQIGGYGEGSIPMPDSLKPYKAPPSAIQDRFASAQITKQDRIADALMKDGRTVRDYEGRTRDEKEWRKNRGYNLGGLIQKFAIGGKASRGVDLDKEFIANPVPSPFNKAVSKKLGPEVYDLEKNSGLSSFEFDNAKRFADTAGYNVEEFKKLLARRAQAKKQRSQTKTNTSELLQQLIPQNRVSTPKQLALAETLKGEPDAGYRPILTAAERIAANRSSIRNSALKDINDATRFAVGGLAEPEQKKEKEYGIISLSEDTGMLNAGYKKNDTRAGYASAYKMRDNLYYVGLSKATSGYGPRLYDVLMEASTEKGGMLTSDRSSVSDDAKKVWEYYFKNRGDVKKTPLKPSDWTVNESLIDPKLYGKESTWPPKTDPAWILQTGYSKSPSLINDDQIVQRLATGGKAVPPPPPKPAPNQKTSVSKQLAQDMARADKEMTEISKKWPIGTKIASGEWKLPGHKSIGVGQFAGDHKELTDFGGSGWKMRVDPKTDKDNILIADWFLKNKQLFSGYKIATNTDHPVWSAYVSHGTGPEIQKAAKKAQSDLSKFISLDQTYDTTDTIIPGTGISGRFEIRGDERSGGPRAQQIVDTINERRKAATKYKKFYLLYKNSPGFSAGFPSSTSGQGGVPGTHYFQWLLQMKKQAKTAKNTQQADEYQAAQDEEIKLIESVLKEKVPEYGFDPQKPSVGVKTRLAPPPPPPPKKFANGGLVPGVGNQDTVPATLNVGDFVIKKSSVNAIGIDKLASMGRYAAGGSVDKVPALLTPGEFVFNKGAAQKIGYSKLNSMNKYAKFASGGAVGMRVGYADGGIVEKLTGFFDVMKSLIEEDRSGKGNLPVRPENIDQSSIAIPKESVSDLEALVQALDQLGIKSTASADLIKTGAEISYQAAEKALEADIHKLKIAGASSAEIIKAEAALNTVRKNGEQQVKSRTVLENAFTTSKSGQKIDSGRTQQNILVLAKREEEQRTASARAAKGSDLTDKEIAGIKSKSFMSATSKITGVSTKGLKQSGVTGEGIEKYIAQSMLDVKTLGEMDKQYTIIRKQQLLAAKIGADEATKIIKQELASRRATLDQVAKSKNMPSLIEKNSGEKLTDFLGSKKGTLLNMGIAAAPGIAKGIMGPATTSSGAGMYAGAQGAASTIGAGLQFASKSGPLAPFVLAGTAVAAFATAVKDSRNAFLEFEKNLKTQNIDKALESASSALESFSRDTEDVFAKADVSRHLTTAGTEAASLTKTEQTIPKAFWFNLLDMKSGSKEATDRSKIMDKFDKDKYIPTAYLSSLSMFGGDEQRRAYTASMIPEEAQSNAKRYAEIGSASRQFIEKRASGGESLADIKASPEFDQLAKNIALSNASVQEQILEIDNSTAYRTQADREAAKEAIIRAHADREVSKITLSAERAKAASELEKTSRSFSMSFKRMFENMDAVISRTNTELSQFNNSLDASIAGMSGQSKNNKTDFESVNILKNPKAYSTDQVNKANAQAGTLFGSDSQIVSGLAGIGEKLETSLLKSINATIKNNPTASDTKIAIDVENAIGKEIGGLGLPKDLAGQLGKEITNAVGDLRKDGTKKIDLDQLMDKIPGLKNAIDSAKNAQNASVEALQNWQNTLNQYSDAMNKAAEMELEASERRRRANDIVVEASMNLGRALGKDYGADSGTQIRNQKVAEMTGGLTNPTDIKNQMTDLEGKRQRQQAEVDLSKQQSVGGGKNSIQAVVANEKALKQTNNQLRQTGAALKLLAESGEAASTALNAIQEAQRKQQGKVGLIEKLVTSGPEELFNFNKSLNSLQKMSAGQTVNQTADERKNTLSVLNDITPLLGSGKEANNLKATALESMLKDSGIGVSAQFQDILTALRNPESDTETQQAIQVYQEAISVQSEANKTLASINQSLADDIAQKTADAISTALQGLTVKFDDKQLADIAKGVRDVATTTAGGKAGGGLIYAAGGSLIDFQPRGTDTVPAMLTAGEFVVNKSATSKNMGLLHDINSGKANYYATGGYVSNIAKPDFRKSGTKATEQEYPELGSGLGKKTFNAYGGLQSLPLYSSKVSMPLSSFTEKEGSGTYVAGSPRLFEAPQSYTLGTGQPSRIKSLLTRGRDTAHLYGNAETTAPILNPLSFEYLDPTSASASVITTKKARIEGEDNFETYKTKLNEVKGMLPSSMKFEDKEYANVDGHTIYFPSQSNVIKWSTRVNPSIQVTKGGEYAEFRLNNLAHSIEQDKFRIGPFLGALPTDPSPELTDYAIGDYLWTSIVAGPANQVSAGRLSVDKNLGFKPLKLKTDDTDADDYMSKLYEITRKINEASKSITGGDKVNFETDNDKKVELFNEQLDKIYKGTVTHLPFTGDFLDLKEFTNDNSIQVYSTSTDQWKSTYLKNLQEQIRNNDKFKDLDYYGKGSKKAVTIEPEGGVATPFPWIGGDTNFEFSDVVKKIMQNEVDANKNKAETLLKSHVKPSKKLPPITKAQLELPYDISYDERKSPGSTTDSIFMVRSPQSDLAVFKNLASNLYVDQAGYSANLPQPMDQVHAQLASYDKLNDYLVELGSSGEESTKSKVLHDEIFRKQVDIKGKFLTSDLNSFDGERTISVPVGDYLISAIKKIKKDKAESRKDNSKVKFKADEVNDEFFTKKQYPGAALAFILGAQELFSSGHQYEVPQLLGKGWFAPRLDNQYKSIYDVDYTTLRNYMGRLGTVFNDKAAIINKFLPRAPNPQIADLLTQTAINIHGAYKVFAAMSEGKTGSIAGLFGKKDFDTATPQGDPALTTKAMEVFQSLGMDQKIDAAGSAALTEDEQKERARDLKGVKLNQIRSKDATTKELGPDNLPKTYLDLFNIAINPYNRFPRRDARRDLLKEFIDAVPNARNPGSNLPLFTQTTGPLFQTALSKLKEWYDGQGSWAGVDYLFEDGVLDPASKEPKSYDTRIQELEANQVATVYDDAKQAYAHIGGKAKFGELPSLEYYKTVDAPQYKQVGGMIYASTGKLINFEPRGTDTVPAMLTPGEFVINRQATQQHLPLLQAINSGTAKGLNKGGIVYLEYGSEKPVDSPSIMETTTPYIQGAGNSADSIVRGADVTKNVVQAVKAGTRGARLGTVLGLGSVASAVGLGNNANVMLAADVGDIGIGAGQAAYEASGGFSLFGRGASLTGNTAKLAGGATGAAAGYGAYVASSYLTNTIGLATGAKDISEYDKANRTQANQSYLKNVGENLYDPGKAGVQFGRETFGLIGDMWNNWGKSSDLDKQLKALQAKKYSSGGLVYLEVGGEVEAQNQFRKETAEQRKQEFIERKETIAKQKAEIREAKKQFVEQQKADRKEYHAQRKASEEANRQFQRMRTRLLGEGLPVDQANSMAMEHASKEYQFAHNDIREEAALRKSKSDTSVDGAEYDPNQDGLISKEEKSSADIQRGLLSLPKDIRSKLRRISNPEEREKKLQDVMKPELYALRHKAMEHIDESRFKELTAKTKDKGPNSLNKEESEFLTQYQAKQTLTNIKQVASSVHQLVGRSSQIVGGVIQGVLSGSLFSGSANKPQNMDPTSYNQEMDKMKGLSPDTTGLRPKTTPVNAQTKQTAAVTQATSATATQNTVPPTPAWAMSPYQSTTTITDDEFNRNTALARSKRAQREQQRENELADAGIETHDKDGNPDPNISKMLKAGVSTKQIIEMNAAKKISDQADVVGGLRNQVAALKSRETSGFFGIGGTNNSAKIKELEKQIAVENLKLEAVKEGPREMTAQEAAVTAKNRAEIDKVKANSKDTRTFSEKYLGLNLQAGYQAAGEQIAGGIAAAELGVNSALDAMGRPANDRSRPDANRVAVNQMLANKAGQNVGHGMEFARNDIPGAAFIMDAAEGSSKIAIGGTRMVGAGLGAGIGAASNGLGYTTFGNTLLEASQNEMARGFIGLSTGVGEMAKATGDLGGNTLHSATGGRYGGRNVGTQAFGEAVATGNQLMDKLYEQKIEHARKHGGDTTAMLVQGADAIGAGAADLALGDVALGAGFKVAGKVTKPVAKLAGKGIEKATKVGKGIINDFKTEGDFSIFTPKGLRQAGSEIRADLKELGSGFSQIPDQMGDALIPGRVARKERNRIAAITAENRSKGLARQKEINDFYNTSKLKTFWKTEREAQKRGIDAVHARRKKPSAQDIKLQQAQDATAARRMKLFTDKYEGAQKAAQEATKEAAQRASMQRTMGVDPATGKYVGNPKATASVYGTVSQYMPSIPRIPSMRKMGSTVKSYLDSAKEGFNYVEEKASDLYTGTVKRVSDYRASSQARKAARATKSSAVGSVNSQAGAAGRTYSTTVPATVTPSPATVTPSPATVTPSPTKATSFTDIVEDAISGLSPEATTYLKNLTNAQLKDFTEMSLRGTSREKQVKLFQDLAESANKDGLKFFEGDSFNAQLTQLKEQGELTEDLAWIKKNTRGYHSSTRKEIGINPDTARHSTRVHELGHYVDDMTGHLSATKGAENYGNLQKMLGPELDQFLDSPEYAELVKGLGSAYDGKTIRSKPHELFTVLNQGKSDIATAGLFKDGSSLQSMLDRSWQARGYRKGGTVYASNGALIDAQRGTDSVPAMLTPGEFVVNRQSAQRYMPVLNAINSGHYSHGGAVKYLASGGMVQPKYLADAGMVNNNITNMSSQSGVLTSTSAARPAPMEKPSWVDEFISKFNQGASTLVQSASEIASGASNIVSGAQKLSEVSLPDSIALNGNFGFTKEAISNIIGRSVGESVSVSASNSANQVASSEANTKSHIAKSTDYGIT